MHSDLIACVVCHDALTAQGRSPITTLSRVRERERSSSTPFSPLSRHAVSPCEHGFDACKSVLSGEGSGERVVRHAHGCKARRSRFAQVLYSTCSRLSSQWACLAPTVWCNSANLHWCVAAAQVARRVPRPEDQLVITERHAFALQAHALEAGFRNLHAATRWDQ